MTIVMLDYFLLDKDFHDFSFRIKSIKNVQSQSNAVFISCQTNRKGTITIKYSFPLMSNQSERYNHNQIQFSFDVKPIGKVQSQSNTVFL